jgi:amino-acid N-acetyltransferase
MTTAYHIEAARRDDLEDVLELLDRSQLPTDGLVDHLGTTIVARDHGRVVASAALEVYADGALLRSVAVDPGCRGQQLGHRLTQAAIALARQRDVPAVYLLTTTAEGFFPKLGFEPIDRQQVPSGVMQSVEFRSACPSTAVVMRLARDQTSPR